MGKKIVIISFIIGIIVLIIGLYYSLIKAGIPYQDPTDEMIQKYNRNARIGGILILIGLSIEFVNFFVYIRYKLKKHNENKV